MITWTLRAFHGYKYQPGEPRKNGVFAASTLIFATATLVLIYDRRRAREYRPRAEKKITDRLFDSTITRQ